MTRSVSERRKGIHMTAMIRWSDRRGRLASPAALLAVACLVSWVSSAEGALAKRVRGVALGTPAAEYAMSFDPFAPVVGSYSATGLTDPAVIGLSAAPDQPTARTAANVDTGDLRTTLANNARTLSVESRYRPPIRVPYRPPLRSPWRPPLI